MSLAVPSLMEAAVQNNTYAGSHNELSI